MNTFESGLSFSVAVEDQENAIVCELAVEAGEFVELLGGDFVAAEADGWRSAFNSVV